MPPIEHLRWKLRGPFAECPSHVVVVESDGLVAYLTISMRGRGRVGGRDLELQTGGDACTHPALGGRGMFTEGSGFSRTHTYPLFDAGLGFSTNATVRRNRVRTALRKSPANEPRSLVRVYRPWAAAAERRAGGLARLAWAVAFTPLALAGAVRRPRLEPGRDWQVAPVTSFDERFDRFFDEAAGQFAFVQVRSAEYLTWRYLDPRAPRATVAAAVDSAGEVLGYVAYKLHGARGSILDVLALPGRLDVVRSLVAHADEAFTRAGASAAQCWLPNVHPYRAVLRAHGFYDSRRFRGATSYIAHSRLAPGTLAFMDDPRAPVHITLSDSDWA